MTGYSDLLITPVQDEEHSIIVRTGDSRTLKNVGNSTPHLSLHRTLFRRLGLWQDNELFGDKTSMTDYRVNGDEGTIIVESEIDLPDSGFDPMSVMTSPETLDLEHEEEYERFHERIEGVQGVAKK